MSTTSLAEQDVTIVEPFGLTDMGKGSYKWFRIPGRTYANTFPKPQASKKEAKAWIRKYLNVKRLPNGTEIW